MRESYRKGVANRLASSLAEAVARLPNQGAQALAEAVEGRARTNRAGHFTLRRQTARKRLEAKLQQVKQTLRARLHEPVPKVGEWLRRVQNGFYQYHAVPGNGDSLKMFRQRIGRYWRHVLKRRSQRGRLTAERMARLYNRWLVQPRLVHPYPSVRFDAIHPR